MRSALRFCLWVGIAGACLAQTWEFGGAGGAGLLTHVIVSAPAGSATAGFRPGAAFGAFAGNRGERFSGELRYMYLDSDLKLTAGGGKATFGGAAHAVHYDLLVHGKRREGPMLFLAVGGGVKIYRGTGREAAYQPLSQFAYLTRTQEVEPLLSVGGGVKFPLGPKVFLRAELRDYITPFPKEVIAAAPGAKVGGWLHNFVPTVGIGFAF